MRSFTEKTLLDIQKIFSDMFYSEKNTEKDGFMQRLDPRVKLVSFLCLVILAAIASKMLLLLLLSLYVITLVYFAGISVKPYLLRVFTVSVLFTGVVVLPVLFNVVKEGSPLYHFTAGFYITREGAFSAAFLILRSFVSLSSFYILIYTTKWLDVLKSLRALRVPMLFVALLEMTQRYIFLLLNLASNMFLARKSRTLAKVNSLEGRKFVANTMGNLLLKSNALSTDVHSAMLSRGYNGEIRTLNRFAVKRADYMWIGLNLVFAAISCFVCYI